MRTLRNSVRSHRVYGQSYGWFGISKIPKQNQSDVAERRILNRRGLAPIFVSTPVPELRHLSKLFAGFRAVPIICHVAHSAATQPAAYTNTDRAHGFSRGTLSLARGQDRACDQNARSKRNLKVFVYTRWKDRALTRPPHSIPGRSHKMGCVVQGGDDILPTGGPRNKAPPRSGSRPWPTILSEW